MLKTKTWIFLILILLAVSSALSVHFLNAKSNHPVAEIVQDGQIIRRVDLSTVTEDYSFTVEWEGGTNTISVQQGRICVSEADCPDKTCVRQGWLSDGLIPIACMPHRLIIRMAEEDEDIDSVAE